MVPTAWVTAYVGSLGTTRPSSSAAGSVLETPQFTKKETAMTCKGQEGQEWVGD